jgi:hypothetical protein
MEDDFECKNEEENCNLKTKFLNGISMPELFSERGQIK